MNFKRYVESSDTWLDSHYIRGTSTDTLSIPQTIYGDGTAATLSLKGNTVQNGTPTPTTPIQPQECGDLETTGEHAGQYKIPISNNSQTYTKYLGEVQSTRNIQKLVLTGQENWTKSGNVYYITSIQPDYLRSATITTICTHYQAVTNVEAASAVNVGEIALFSKIGENQRLYIGDDRFANTTEFADYLAQQYANGTPVTVWYVLNSATTGIVNEPLRKIGDYADTLSTSIPTVDGANAVDVLTSLKPSEITANYHGWHSVSAAHERSGGRWD